MDCVSINVPWEKHWLVLRLYGWSAEEVGFQPSPTETGLRRDKPWLHPMSCSVCVSITLHQHSAMHETWSLTLTLPYTPVSTSERSLMHWCTQPWHSASVRGFNLYQISLLVHRHFWKWQKLEIQSRLTWSKVTMLCLPRSPFPVWLPLFSSIAGRFLKAYLQDQGWEYPWENTAESRSPAQDRHCSLGLWEPYSSKG